MSNMYFYALFLLVLVIVFNRYMDLASYLIYFGVGVLFFLWWYANHPPTPIYFNELPMPEKILSVAIYAHLWPVDLVISLFRFFVLKHPFEEI